MQLCSLWMHGVGMGAIWWGTRGTCVPPPFYTGGTWYAMSPHFFLLGIVFGGVSKLNVTFVTFCVEFFMLDITHNHVDVETEFGVVSLILIYLFWYRVWLILGKAIGQTMFGQSKGYPTACRVWQREIERIHHPPISSKNKL